jgi:hypothetical protein
MLQYINNIIPRIQKYSKSLDKIEVFVDKPWVLTDESKNVHEYMFLRDRRLILSLNGIVKEGKWELLPNGKLLINRVEDQILLQNMFIDDAVMILKMSGTTDVPFLLINEERIPDLDVMKYLEREQEKYLQKSVVASVETKARNLLGIDGLVSGPRLWVDERVETLKGEIVTGVYETTRKDPSEYLQIENGIIKSKYYVRDYYHNNSKIQIKQKEFFVQEKDVILNYQAVSPTEPMKHVIKDSDNEVYRIEVNSKGEVIRVRDIWKSILNGTVIVLVVIILAAMVILRIAFE